MSLFSDKDIRDISQKAAMQHFKEKLRNNGLSHLNIKMTHKSGDTYDLTLSGGSDTEMQRAKKILGVKDDSAKQIGAITPETIDSGAGIIEPPEISSPETSSPEGVDKNKKQK